MDTPHLAFVFVILIWSGHVNAFSISRRAERSTDLADALAILQRQRRRVGAEDFLGPERLLDGRPLTLEDVSDWLSRSRGLDSEDNDMDTTWMSDQGDFQDFENEARLSGYELPALPPPQPPERMLGIPNTVRPSQAELEDIFDKGDLGKDDSGEQDGLDPASSAQNLLEKKKKEVVLNVKDRDMKVVQKKSMLPSPSAVENTSDGNLSLDTLTKDEFKALMKAVAKLQKQANRLNDISTTESEPKHIEIKETIVEPIPPVEEIAVVEPVSKDELESVFEETEGPILTETVVKETDGEDNIISDKELLSNIAEEVDEERQRELTDALASQLASDVVEEQEAEEEAVVKAAQEEIEAEEQGDNAEEDTDMSNVKNIDPDNLATIEKYWLMSKYLNTNSLQKRAAKRSYFTLPDATERGDSDLMIDDIISSSPADGDDDDDNVDDVDNFDLVAMTANANLQGFITKILELQQELDRLRIVARLEDLENDVLTDALNEATLSQKAGTVSDIEFQALQQAIRIEEALQDMKKAKTKAQDASDVKKRGEPWRRKKQPDLSRDDDALITDVALPSYPATSRVTVPQVSRADMNRVLDLTYPPDVEDDTDAESTVASLFLSNPDDCPAVREYSTNCELADVYALPVDYEARSLCNLHEMCYACGHSLNVPQAHCDLVYRAAASALCQNKDSCLSESEIFLRAMKLRTRYVQHKQPNCRSTCAARFLGML